MYQMYYHAGTDDSNSRQKQGTTNALHNEILQQSKYLYSYVAVTMLKHYYKYCMQHRAWARVVSNRK